MISSSEAFQRGASFALIQQDVDAAFRDPRPAQRSATRDHCPTSLRRSACGWRTRLAALQQIARFWRRKLDLRVIGITGSVGKSTTKEVVAQVLSQRYRTLKKPGQPEQ